MFMLPGSPLRLNVSRDLPRRWSAELVVVAAADLQMGPQSGLSYTCVPQHCWPSSCLTPLSVITESDHVVDLVEVLQRLAPSFDNSARPTSLARRRE